MAFGIPQDQRGQQRFLGIFLLVAGFAGFWMYVHRPKQSELTEIEDRLSQLQQQNRQAEAQSTDLDRVREELEQAERVYAALRELVPPRAEVPAIYEAIAQEVQALDLDLNQVNPEDPEPVEEGAPYLRQRWMMAVEGDYHTVGEFLARVASLPRIVRPEVQELRPTSRNPSGRQPVEVTMELEMFVLPPDTAGSRGGGGSGAAN